MKLITLPLYCMIICWFWCVCVCVLINKCVILTTVECFCFKSSLHIIIRSSWWGSKWASKQQLRYNLHHETWQQILNLSTFFNNHVININIIIIIIIIRPIRKQIHLIQTWICLFMPVFSYEMFSMKEGLCSGAKYAIISYEMLWSRIIK